MSECPDLDQIQTWTVFDLKDWVVNVWKNFCSGLTGLWSLKNENRSHYILEKSSSLDTGSTEWH